MALLLTSTAIPISPDGAYPWSIEDWLAPHEAIRREFLRLEAALVTFRPFKPAVIARWLHGFLLPAIRVHHDSEELVIGPHFAALGDVVQWGSTYSHVDLERDMERVAAAADAAVGAANDPAGESAFSELRGVVAQLSQGMAIHLAEEERCWPLIFAKHGPRVVAAAMAGMHARTRALPPVERAASDALAASCMDAMAPSFLARTSADYEARRPASGLRLPPWCSRAASDKFSREKIPWIARALIFPRLHASYLRDWQALIDRAAGDAIMVDAAGGKAGWCGVCC